MGGIHHCYRCPDPAAPCQTLSIHAIQEEMVLTQHITNQGYSKAASEGKLIAPDDGMLINEARRAPGNFGIAMETQLTQN